MNERTNLPSRIILSLLILCTFSSRNSFSQIDFHSFSLDSFKLPDITRRALDVTGSLYGNYSDNYYGNGYTTSALHPSIDIRYNRYINRSNLQSNLNLQVIEDFSSFHNKSTIPTHNRSGNDYHQFFQFTGEWRKYKGQSFFETGMNGASDYSHSNESPPDTSHFITDPDGFSINLSPSIGFGTGRLELISDLPTAMFLLKDAIDIGLDGSSITTGDLYEFAGLMATVRNKRIFDSRRKRVQELRELYNFMLSKNWTLQTDPGFFTVLTDNWSYNTFYNRYAGMRWTYLLTPSFYHLSYPGGDGFGNDYRSDELGGTASVEFATYKPVSLFKDNIHTHILSISVVNSNEEGTFLTPSKTYMQFRFGNSLGKNWYPNNRTSILCELTGDYFYYRMLSAAVISPIQDNHIFSLGLTGNATYLLSYKTRLVANAIITYDYSTNTTPYFYTFRNTSNNGVYARLIASLIVSIF